MRDGGFDLLVEIRVVELLRCARVARDDDDKEEVDEDVVADEEEDAEEGRGGPTAPDHDGSRNGDPVLGGQNDEHGKDGFLQIDKVWADGILDGAAEEIDRKNCKDDDVGQNKQEHQEGRARGVGDGDEELPGAFEVDGETKDAQRAKSSKRREDGSDTSRLHDSDFYDRDTRQCEIEQVDEGLEVERAEGEDAKEGLDDEVDAAEEVDPIADVDDELWEIPREDGERYDVEAGDEDGDPFHERRVRDVLVEPEPGAAEEARVEEEGIGERRGVHVVEKRFEETLVGVRHVPFRRDVVLRRQDGDEEVHDAEGADDDDGEGVQDSRRPERELSLLDFLPPVGHGGDLEDFKGRVAHVVEVEERVEVLVCVGSALGAEQTLRAAVHGIDRAQIRTSRIENREVRIGIRIRRIRRDVAPLLKCAVEELQSENGHGDENDDVESSDVAEFGLTGAQGVEYTAQLGNVLHQPLEGVDEADELEIS